jgi:hypothetical protein
VPIHGFILKDAEKPADMLVVPRPAQVDNPRSKAIPPTREYAPLLEYTGLFRTFADTPLTKEAVLKFANKFGCLGEYKGERGFHRGQLQVDSCPFKDESFGTWCDEIAEMRRTVLVWDLIKSKNEIELARYIRWQQDDYGNALVKYVSEPDLDLEEAERKQREGTEIKVELIAPQHDEGHLLASIKAGNLFDPARCWVKRKIVEQVEKRVFAGMYFTVGEEGMSYESVPSDLGSSVDRCETRGISVFSPGSAGVV